MRVRIFLAAIAAAALLWATPLTSPSLRADDDDDDDRGGWRFGDYDDGDWDDDDGDDGNWRRGRAGFYVGPGGFSIGPGRFSIGVRPYGYGYGYGRYWSPGSGYSYGYPRGWSYRTYGGYYDGDYYMQPGRSYSYQVEAPYDGPGVAICNHADVELSFTIDDRRHVRIAPGETMRLGQKGQFVISFDRGSDFGSARYAIHEGLYEFIPTDGGWELYRQKADDAIADQPNPDAIPRTAERPRIEELPRPRDDRSFDDRPRRETELPPPPRPY
jgi:hypothetical protein